MKAHFLCLQCGQQASNEFRQEKGVKQSIPLSLSGGQPMAIQVGTPRNPHQVNTVFRGREGRHACRGVKNAVGKSLAAIVEREPCKVFN